MKTIVQLLGYQFVKPLVNIAYNEGSRVFCDVRKGDGAGHILLEMAFDEDGRLMAHHEFERDEFGAEVLDCPPELDDGAYSLDLQKHDLDVVQWCAPFFLNNNGVVSFGEGDIAPKLKEYFDWADFNARENVEGYQGECIEPMRENSRI